MEERGVTGKILILPHQYLYGLRSTARQRVNNRSPQPLVRTVLALQDIAGEHAVCLPRRAPHQPNGAFLSVGGGQGGSLLRNYSDSSNEAIIGQTSYRSSLWYRWRRLNMTLEGRSVFLFDNIFRKSCPDRLRFLLQMSDAVILSRSQLCLKFLPLSFHVLQTVRERKKWMQHITCLSFLTRCLSLYTTEHFHEKP